MLAGTEVENLLAALFEATDLADLGRVEDGYRLLVEAREKALGSGRAGTPLSVAWDSAIRRYARRYGVERP